MLGGGELQECLLHLLYMALTVTRGSQHPSPAVAVAVAAAAGAGEQSPLVTAVADGVLEAHAEVDDGAAVLTLVLLLLYIPRH